MNIPPHKKIDTPATMKQAWWAFHAEQRRKAKEEKKAKSAAAKAAQKKKRKPKQFKSKDPFLQSKEWKELRYKAFVAYGNRCQCCGASAKDEGVRLNVDHIKPRRKYPHLALCLDNLQILCGGCNRGKSNKDKTDWRGEPSAPQIDQTDAQNLSCVRTHGL